MAEPTIYEKTFSTLLFTPTEIDFFYSIFFLVDAYFRLLFYWDVILFDIRDAYGNYSQLFFVDLSRG